MFRYKDYISSLDGQKAKFKQFYKELLTLLSKYGYCGQKIGFYDVFNEINKMKYEILKEFEKNMKED